MFCSLNFRESACYLLVIRPPDAPPRSQSVRFACLIKCHLVSSRRLIPRMRTRPEANPKAQPIDGYVRENQSLQRPAYVVETGLRGDVGDVRVDSGAWRMKCAKIWWRTVRCSWFICVGLTQTLLLDLFMTITLFTDRACHVNFSIGHVICKCHVFPPGAHNA